MTETTMIARYLYVTISPRAVGGKIVVVSLPGIGRYFAPIDEFQRLIAGERDDLTLHPLPGGSACRR